MNDMHNELVGFIRFRKQHLEKTKKKITRREGDILG